MILLQTVYFTRTKKSEPEWGLMVNGDELLIDGSGKVVPSKPQIYNWEPIAQLSLELPVHTGRLLVKGRR